MASNPKDLRYTPSHEWVRVEGDTATVGITHFAQDALGDVVHVELPTVGDQFPRGASVAEIESTKAVSEVYTPVSGEIVAVNEALDGSEESVNTSPYGDGWLFKVALADLSELNALLDAQTYAAHCEAQDH